VLQQDVRWSQDCAHSHLAGLAGSLTHLTLRGDICLTPATSLTLAGLTSLTSLTLWLKVG
jgi:hypothetical protein